MKFIEWLWPRAELLRLRAERVTLIQAQRNAMDAATDARMRLSEALERENAALLRESTAIKQVANYAVFAGGSRIPIFPEVGPELPKPKYDEAPEPVQGRRRASEVAREKTKDYLKAFQESSIDLPPIDIDRLIDKEFEQVT